MVEPAKTLSNGLVSRIASTGLAIAAPSLAGVALPPMLLAVFGIAVSPALILAVLALGALAAFFFPVIAPFVALILELAASGLTAEAIAAY